MIRESVKVYAEIVGHLAQVQLSGDVRVGLCLRSVGQGKILIMELRQTNRLIEVGHFNGLLLLLRLLFCAGSLAQTGYEIWAPL
jgi:hypothetical protein